METERASSSPAEAIVERAIEDVRAEGREQTGNEIGKSVEEKVTEQTDALRDQFGDAVEDLTGEAQDTVKGYRESLTELVGDHHVGKTEEQGAAGFNDKGDGNKVVISETATDLHVEDPDYWKRVKLHEEEHQNNHAGTSNLEFVQYVDQSGELKKASVVGNLTERNAIRAAKQPDSDLVPEYVEHAEIGDEVADVVGEEELHTALKSGDAQKLQETIITKQREQITKALLDGKLKATQFAQAA